MITEKFVWRGIKKQVSKWVSECIPCQRSKVQRHTKAPLQTFAVPQRRFDHINIDIVGPLPQSRDYTYLFTIVDRLTRWPEANPITDATATTCARALAQNWIARFGVPSDMTSDRGKQFTSQIWTELSKIFGTQLHYTTAYHPQANGLVERFHRQLKSSLRARLNGPDWVDELPWVLLGIRTQPKEDLQTSSAELVYGAPLTLPGEFVAEGADVTSKRFIEILRNKITHLNPTPTTRHCRTTSFIPRDQQYCEYVFVRRDAHRTPLQMLYEGPYRVLQRDEKAFTVDIGGRPELISIDRLKPARLDPDVPVQVAQPPRRGRPRKQQPSQ